MRCNLEGCGSEQSIPLSFRQTGCIPWNIKTIVREYQQDPVTDKLTHVDFMAINAKKKLNTKVPLELIGESKVVREQGGQLNKKTDTNLSHYKPMSKQYNRKS